MSSEGRARGGGMQRRPSVATTQDSGNNDLADSFLPFHARTYGKNAIFDLSVPETYPSGRFFVHYDRMTIEIRKRSTSFS
jgi:CxxC motif-containing protein (DUF1111 family)